jgi:hypothetical protein
MLSQIKTAKTQNKFAGNKKAVIVINGTITGTTECPTSTLTLVTISGVGSYPHLVFRGDDTAGGVLDAQNQRRVFQILDKNEVTIAAKLTLQNGRAISDTSQNNYGGGIFMISATVNMTGGAILNCAGGVGSAVHIGDWGSTVQGVFNMSGGEISGCINNPKSDSGTIFVDKTQKMTLSGTAKIHGNGLDGSAALGGGIYLSGGELTMSGGEISGNRVNKQGGGVRSTINSTFIMTGGTITGNTAPTDGGGGVAYFAGTYTRSGAASVSGNTGGDEVTTKYF